MTLTISVITHQENLPQKSCSVDESELNIGRGRNNQLVLPDSQRIISHQHAQIRYINGQYILEDKSTNGTFINEQPDPVGNGNQVVLHQGDKISIGEYDMLCQIETRQEAFLPEDSKLWQLKGVDTDKTGLLYQDQSDIPYPDELTDADAIPEDFDFLRPESHTPPEPPQVDDLGAEHDFFTPPQPLDMDLEKGKSDKKKVPPSRENPAKKTLLNEDEELAAFFTGLGLNKPDVGRDEMLALMHTAGKVLREMTRGYTQILKNRTVIKSEFRLDVTLLAAIENNPLKFAIDTDDALSKLLFKSHKGYLPAVPAVREAVIDLQGHEMAIFAGLRAALGSLVSRFNPDKLERNFQDGSFLDNLLPVAKKAKYWEMFKEIYQGAAADAENDFLRVLGKEFADAYQEQMKELKRAKTAELSNIS